MISVLLLILVSIVMCFSVAVAGEGLGWSQRHVFILNCLLCILLGVVWP